MVARALLAIDAGTTSTRAIVFDRDGRRLEAVIGLVDDPELVPDVLQQARQLAASGRPVLVNAILGKTDFRKGSISI